MDWKKSSEKIKKEAVKKVGILKDKINDIQPLSKKAKIAIVSGVTAVSLGVVGGGIALSNHNAKVASQSKQVVESQAKETKNKDLVPLEYKKLSDIKDNGSKEIALNSIKGIKTSDIVVSVTDEKIAKAFINSEGRLEVNGVSSGDTSIILKDKDNTTLDTVHVTIEKSDETLAKEKAEKEEQERIAKEKAEQERIAQEKAEQERIAQEQAEQQRIAQEKAEQERIAQEQAEQQRIAQEQAEQQAQQTSIPKNQTLENVPSSEMVWITETGSKYHCKNTCGSTNPENASQVTRAKAESMGLKPCKKCY